MEKKKNRYLKLLWLLLTLPLVSTISTVITSVAASAQGKDMSDSDVAKILVKCSSVFEQNSLVSSIFRFLGWLIMKLLAKLSSACESLYNTCFKFVDFTSYSQVEQYIDKFQVVWIALVCLSILFLGIILIFWQDKKPKFIVNLLIAVLVVSSSGYIIDKMNGFLSTSVRNELMGGSGSVATYSVIGSNVRDLVYMDAKVGIANLYDKNGDGIRNYKGTYQGITKKQFELMKINETLDPADYSGDLKNVLKVRPVYVSASQIEAARQTAGRYSFFVDASVHKVGDESYVLEDVYDGVAWTNLLNEHYYRYTVDWLPAYLELLSLIIVYLFMSYKVIRSLYEIAVNRLLAYLYSANFSGGKKILKILDSIKDTYIVLILTMVCIKFYLIATGFISTMNMNGISKGLILLFLAFAVLDGPNMVQKLTGIDAGMSDGMGKMMGMFYGSQMAGSVARTAAGMAKGAGGLLMKPFSDGSFFGGNGQQPGDVPEPPSGQRPDDPGSAGGGQDPSGGNEKGEGNALNGEKPDTNGVPKMDDQNSDMNTEGNSNLNQNGVTDGSGMPDSDNNALDTGTTNGEESLPDGEIQVPDGTTDGNMPENDITSRTDSGQGFDNAFADDTSQNLSGDSGIVSASSGNEELLNGMDPATGSMSESLASSMENMEKDLGGNNSQGMAGNKSSLMSASPARHAGSMFSPERHSGGKQEIPHSDISTTVKAESQVERNMAFDNNDMGGTP